MCRMNGGWLHDEEIKKPDKDTRADHDKHRIFQRQTTNGNPRYPMLTRIVKAAHVLPHGNSDVDSGKRDFKKQQNVKN